MGWSNGATIAASVWSLVRDHIPDDKRRTIAGSLVEIFEDEDADTMHEARQLMKDAGRAEEEFVEDEFYDRY